MSLATNKPPCQQNRFSTAIIIILGISTTLSLWVMPLKAAASAPLPWVPPVAPPLIIGDRFAPPDFNWHSGHRGVDLCPGVGSQVVAPVSGTVIYAGKLNDRQLVSLQLADGWRVSLEPLADISVKVGQVVSPRQKLGVLAKGHTKHGNPQEANNCLHWGVRNAEGKYLNPLQFLFERPRLLPWDAPAPWKEK